MSCDRAIAFVLRAEGGRTRFGISSAAYPQLNVAGLTRDDAIEIYRRDYWDRVRGDELPGPVALVALDTAVLFGVRRSAIELQLAVHARPDGIIGPKTVRAAWYWAASSRGPAALAAKLVRQRSRLHARRVRRDPSQAVFLAGWWARTLDLQRAALEWDESPRGQVKVMMADIVARRGGD